MEMFLYTLKWSAVIGVAALALGLLKGPLDRRYSAKWRYWAWLVMAALLLLAPLGSLLPRGTAAVEIPVPSAQVTVGAVTGVRARGYFPTEKPEAPLVYDREIRLSDLPTGEELREAYRGRGVSVDTAAVLPALWLAGVVGFALYHVVGTVWFSRRVRRWSRPASGEMVRRCGQVAAELGVKRPPLLTVSSAVDSPLVLGLLRPWLVLPEGEIPPAELDFVLRHELTHCRRRDLWYSLLLLAANAVHWFDPLVYLLRREALADMELTCDDAVVAGCGVEERRAYSETLLAAVHRQRGLGRSALSTQFYGGARRMKDRFRNILAGRGRKWGGVALALVLTATLATACALGFRAVERGELSAEPLTAEELAAWQEKLESDQWNGFLTRMYTDVRYLPLADLLCSGAGISYWPTEEERTQVAEAWGFAPEVNIFAFRQEEIQTYLAEHTGYSVADFKGRLRGLMALEDDESCYMARGEAVGCPVQVLSGSRRGETVELSLALPQGNLSGMDAGTLTLVDGKVNSFTAPLYTAVEAEAWAMVQEMADSLPKIEDSCITDLCCVDSVASGENTWTVWHLDYLLKPGALEEISMAGARSVSGGWLANAYGPYDPIILAKVDAAGELVELVRTNDIDFSEEGYTWEEIVLCGQELGMELLGKMVGWPELDTPLVMSLMEGGCAWATQRDQVALQYLERQGRKPKAEGISVRRSFTQEPDGDSDQSVLLEVPCGDGTAVLLMDHVIYPVESWSTQVQFWQVNSVLWPDGASHSGGDDGGENFIYTAPIALNDQVSGQVHVEGKTFPDGSAGVKRVQVTWDGDKKGAPYFYAREAIAAERGEACLDTYTTAWDQATGLLLEDVNFDGYTDIGLLTAEDGDSRVNASYYVWLYDPAEANPYSSYVYTLKLPCDVLTHPADQTLSWNVLSESEENVLDRVFYRWTEEGLVLDRREEHTGAIVDLGTAVLWD